MKKKYSFFMICLFLMVWLEGCGSEVSNTQVETITSTGVMIAPTTTATVLPSPTFTNTPSPSNTPTPEPSPTPIPQPVVINKNNIGELQLTRKDPIYPNGVPQSAIWSPDGSKIILTTNLGLDILDGETLEMLHQFPNTIVKFFMEDGRLFVQSNNFDPAFINLQTFEVTPLSVDNLKNEEGFIIPYAISPDGNLMAVADQPNKIKIINLSSQSSREFEYYLKENVIFDTMSLMFAPDNNQLFLMILRPGYRFEIVVLDVGKEMITNEIFGEWSFPKFSPDGKRLVFSPKDYVTLIVPETMSEWSSHTYVFRSTISTEESAWYSGEAYSFQVDSSKLGILYNGTVTNRSKKRNHFVSTLFIYNTGSGKVEKYLNDLPPTAFDFQFNPDGSRFFTISMDGFIRLWNTEDGKFLIQSKAYDTSEFNNSISQNGSKLAFPIPGGARILSAETGEIIKELNYYPEGYPYSFSASFVNNDTIAISFQSYSWTQTDTYDLNTNEMVRRYPELSNCYFNRGGNTMICDRGDLKLFDVDTGRTLLQFRPVDGGNYFAISDDGLYTAYCTPGSETVFLWDTQKGTQIRYLRNNNAPVCAPMDFSEDSSLLVAASGTSWSIPDGNLQTTFQVKDYGLVTISPDKEFVLIYPNVFELQNGKLITALPAATGQISDVFFSADGKEIVLIGEKEIFHYSVLK